jgi:imidazolonepropionase-like amidohydrolase
MGGMTAEEALHAGTLGSAETIGRVGELGSLTPGKFADLLILDVDPRADIRNTLRVGSVMKNGRLYDATNLNQTWPDNLSTPEPWFAHEYPNPGDKK